MILIVYYTADQLSTSGLDGLPAALECDGIWGRGEHSDSPKTDMDAGSTDV